MAISRGGSGAEQRDNGWVFDLGLQCMFSPRSSSDRSCVVLPQSLNLFCGFGVKHSEGHLVLSRPSFSSPVWLPPLLFNALSGSHSLLSSSLVSVSLHIFVVSWCLQRAHRSAPSFFRFLPACLRIA